MDNENATISAIATLSKVSPKLEAKGVIAFYEMTYYLNPQNHNGNASFLFKAEVSALVR